MNQTKKELKKSLNHWKKEFSQLADVIDKLPEDESFLLERLKLKAKEAEEIIEVIEKQLGGKSD